MAQAQTTHTETEAHGGAHEDIGFPPFATETFGGQLLWLVITFALLYLLLSRLVLPRLTGIIENRRAMIAKDLDDAAAMKTRAEELESNRIHSDLLGNFDREGRWWRVTQRRPSAPGAARR